MPGVWTNLIVGPLCVGWGKEGVGGGCLGGGWRGWKKKEEEDSWRREVS